MKKNVASQHIGAQMITAADGTAFTSTVTVYVTGDNGTQAIGSVGSGICVSEGNGFHSYEPAQAETNYDFVAFTFIGTGAIPATVEIFTSFPQTVDNATNISAIKTKTDFLPSATAGNSGGVFIAGTNAATTVTTSFTTTFTGNLTGSVGSLTGHTVQTGDSFVRIGAAGAGLTNIGTIATVTNLTNLPTIPANWITAAGITASAMDGKGDWNVGKTGYSLTQAFPTNFSDLSIAVTTGLVDITQTAADKSWSSASRTLTASTNFNDLSAAQVNAECDTAITDAALATAAELAKVPKSDGTATWNATALASINAEADTALADYDSPTNAEMEARTPTAAQLAYIVANAATGFPVTFTTAGGATTTAVFALVDGSAGSTTDDQYNGKLLVFTDGTLKGVVTDITDYTGSTTTATITGIPFAPTSSHNARLI
jgi:hypothetical protein